MSTSHRYRSLWPSWTRDLHIPPKLSISIRKSLISITKALQTANNIIREEAQRDREHCEQQLGRKAQYAGETKQRKSYFKEGDLAVLDRVQSLSLPALDGDFTGLQWSLTDTSYLSIWRAAINSLLDYQGSHYEYLSWKLAKQQALDILEQRDIAAELFEHIEDELRTRTFDVCDGIIAKIKMLERFTAIYDAQPSPPVTMDHNPGSEPHYHLYPLQNKKIMKGVVEAYPQMQQRSYPSTLIAIVSVTTLIAIIPMGFAWTLSSNTKGSTTDVDFYLLIQNSAMSILGIFTAMYPKFWRPASHAKRWGQGFAILGVSCASAAVPIYLYFPTMWSALASFLGVAIQAFMTLQLVVAADSSISPLKEE